MPKTMLIDATHSEETRVAVVDGQRLVEYDYESKVRKQLKGSIFLAKVTRVEPSLQAAFVNFGGNRHGFLPFSEIHPDYFRIPVADREALLAAQMAELEEHDEEMEQAEAATLQQGTEVVEGFAVEELDDEEDDESEAVVEVGGEDQPLIEGEEDSEEESEEENYKAPMAMDSSSDVLLGPVMDEEGDEDNEGDEGDDEQSSSENADEPMMESEVPSDENRSNQRGRGRGRQGGRNNRGRGRGGSRGRNGNGGADRDDHAVESIGGDGVDGDRPFRFNLRRSYKIQEVIKRGQIMLIQVSKEERGNKGAAVTTYLSMPGRYCVLMPNSPRGGGVSRKIASFKDRARMKEILSDLTIPEGMSVILRTAGVTRAQEEIDRDLDYLTRLWNTIRENTLKSVAPSLIYEEGNLIKRAIRDLYSRDIDDVHVAGSDGFKNAREFMSMLMPSSVKKVQEYKNDRTPLFHKFGVESQIADIGEPTVNLKSGGYLVINPTEALVSIDVNSGRATKERHIEETALKTNLEAADELARQLRLRDLGGLVVVDFIDMEDRRNNRKVEQRLRDALSNDRARIQVGRISSFGLLELSRQRLNPSLAEAQQEICAHCAGTGRVKTLDFSAISIIRALEAEGVKTKANEIRLTMASNVALYLLNNKRKILNEIESRYGFDVIIETDDTMSTSHYKLEGASRVAAPKSNEPVKSVSMDDGDAVAEDFDEDVGEEEGQQPADNHGRFVDRDGAGRSEQGDRGDRNGRNRGRRGGRNRGGRDNNNRDCSPREPQPLIEGSSPADDSIGNRVPSENINTEGRDGRPDRDRGRRGGRNRGGRNRGPRREGGNNEAPQSNTSSGQADFSPAPQPQATVPSYEPPVLRATPSNDRQRSEAPTPRNYETVNEAPENKKKGWWNKLIE